MSSIDEIKARIDIVDRYRSTFKLRQTGKALVFARSANVRASCCFPDSGTAVLEGATRAASSHEKEVGFSNAAHGQAGVVLSLSLRIGEQ